MPVIWAIGKLRQEDFWEFSTIFGYVVSLKSVLTTQWVLSSDKQHKQFALPTRGTTCTDGRLTSAVDCCGLSVESPALTGNCLETPLMMDSACSCSVLLKGTKAMVLNLGVRQEGCKMNPIHVCDNFKKRSIKDNQGYVKGLRNQVKHFPRGPGR